MSIKSIAMLAVVGLSTFASIGAVSADTNTTTYGRYGVNLNIDYTNHPNEDQGEQYTSTGRIVRVHGVSDWSQNSWNNEGQKVYNFTAELGEQYTLHKRFM